MNNPPARRRQAKSFFQSPALEIGFIPVTEAIIFSVKIFIE